MSKFLLANSQSYNNSAFSAELTGYAAGVNAPSVEEMLEFLCPTVKVPSCRFEYRKFGKGQFAADTSDERAVFGEFKMINNPQEIIQEKVVHRGLAYLMDDDEIDAGEENRVVEELKKRLLRNELLRANSLLETVAVTTNAKWVVGNDITKPDSDLRKMLFDTIAKSGLRANRILFGGEAWQKRSDAYEQAEADGSHVAANLSLEQLAMKLRAEKIMISEDIYAGVDTSNGKEKKLGIISPLKVYGFNGIKGATKEDPSTFKRFVAKDGFKVFVEQLPAGKKITVSYYSKIVQTGASGAVALNITA